MATEQDLKIDAGTEAKPKSKLKLILFIVLALLLLGGGGAAAYWFLLAGTDAAMIEGEAVVEEEVVEEPPVPAQYIMLKPEFVVSYQVGPRQRFLQVSIEVMSRKQTAIDALTLNEPMVRNEILRVLGEQEFAQLRTDEGRKALQANLHERVSQLLKREAFIEPDDIEAVLFTNFVMQ
tara:strand:+ start:6061 stop:6594 length:534 start_codon:yes stop_codon:yes gene_type:complete